MSHNAEDDARILHAEVTPTGSDIEPTGVVEMSIELLRELVTAAGWELDEHVTSPAAETTP